MTTAEILKDYMDSRGMRYRFFAEKIGISYASLYTYMYKGVHPGKMVAMRIESVTDGQLKAKDLIKKEA